MEKKSNTFDVLLGIGVVFGLVTGIAGLLTAVYAFFSGEWLGTGLCLLAAAVAFGQIANALLRK